MLRKQMKCIGNLALSYRFPQIFRPVIDMDFVY